VWLKTVYADRLLPASDLDHEILMPLSDHFVLTSKGWS
jgi:hypothetical protein